MKIYLITPSFWIPAKGFNSHLGTPLLSCHTLLHVVAWLHYCHVTLCYMLLCDFTIVMSHSVTCCYVTPLLSCHTLLHVVTWPHYCHVTLCYMLLRVFGSCFAKSETGQTFEPTTPIISFVPWSPKRSQRTCITHLLSPWSFMGLYPSHNVLQVPTMLGVVASICT